MSKITDDGLTRFGVCRYAHCPQFQTFIPGMEGFPLSIPHPIMASGIADPFPIWQLAL